MENILVKVLDRRCFVLMHTGRLLGLGGVFGGGRFFLKSCSTEAENNFPHGPIQSDFANIQSQHSKD